MLKIVCGFFFVVVCLFLVLLKKSLLTLKLLGYYSMDPSINRSFMVLSF